MRTRSTAVCALAATAIFAAGCGTTEIDKSKAQKLIQDSLSKAGNTGTATCPSGVKAKKGSTFQCSVKLTDGRTANVTVHITSSGGKIEVAPSDYHLTGK